MSNGPPAIIPTEPKPPEAHHHDFHRLSYAFYYMRVTYIGDRFFNPWEGKQLALCKKILKEKARGNVDETRRRVRNLAAHFRIEPDFWSLEPKTLLSQWERLALPPILNGGRVEMKRDIANSERDARRALLRKEAENERARMATNGGGLRNRQTDALELVRTARNAIES